MKLPVASPVALLALPLALWAGAGCDDPYIEVYRPDRWPGLFDAGDLAGPDRGLPARDRGVRPPTGGTPHSGQGGSAGSGGTPPPACDPGLVRCVVEGQGAIEVCSADGQWGKDVCPDDGPCYGDRCLPGPDCAVRTTLCLTERLPARCDPVAGWVPEPACLGGEACIDGACVAEACALAAAERSYLGCEYWALVLPNYAPLMTPDGPAGVVLVNAGEQVAHLSVYGGDRRVAPLLPRVRVEPPAQPGAPVFDAVTVESEVRDASGEVIASQLASADGLEVPPGGTATLLLPRLDNQANASTVLPQAYRLRTDVPIAAYQFNPLCCNYSYSNDASLLIPTSALGLEYAVLGVPGWQLDAAPFLPGGVAIVATADDTEVTVDLSGATRVMPDLGGRLRMDGDTAHLSLDAHDVAVLQTEPGDTADLSGARVAASAPVAVFSTHYCSYYPEATPACDHLEEQLFPAATLGTDYVLVPNVFRGEPVLPSEVTYWKLLAVEGETHLRLSVPYDELAARPPGFARVPDCRDHLAADGQTLVLGPNRFCELGTQHAFAVQADALVMVMGIMAGQDATGLQSGFGLHAGDPSIFLVAPDGQYRDDYAFLVPGTYANDYLTVVADADTEIALDGARVDLGDATPVPGTPRVYVHVPLADGAHRVVGDKPFGILVSAFDDYVSYAFTGGLNLRKR